MQSQTNCKVRDTPGSMHTLPSSCLLVSCCFTVCIYGTGHDISGSCGVMVRSGTTLKTVPLQRLTVRCPVKHCGESPRVTWCKQLDTHRCDQINHTGNVEITQNDDRVEDQLISYLTFTRISIQDDGLYRCLSKGHKSEDISHSINISVSDLNQRMSISDYKPDELPSAAGGEDVSWLPYFYICASIALLVLTLTVLTLLCSYGWKREDKHTEGQTMQEMSTHIIPNFPNRSAPSTRFLNDNNYSPSTAETQASRPPPMADGNQLAVANATDEVSNHAVYAVVNHRQSGIPAREQRDVTKPRENSQYAAINVS